MDRPQRTAPIKETPDRPCPSWEKKPSRAASSTRAAIGHTITTLKTWRALSTCYRRHLAEAPASPPVQHIRAQQNRPPNAALIIFRPRTAIDLDLLDPGARSIGVSRQLVGDPACRTFGTNPIGQRFQTHPRSPLLQPIGILPTSHNNAPSTLSPPPLNPERSNLAVLIFHHTRNTIGPPTTREVHG